MRVFDPIAAPLGGTGLIEASAGTGKTFTISTLVVRLVLERGLGIEQILVVTFTEAAAAELRDRIRARLRAALDHAAVHTPGHTPGDTPGADPVLTALWNARPPGSRQRDRDRIELALRSFDQATISTIHGFCHRVLTDRAFETGVPFDLELLPDPEPLVDMVVRDFWARELYDADPRFVRHLEKSRVTPVSLLSLARLSLSHRDVPVIPDRIPADDPDARPFVHAFGAARTVWHAQRDTIVELLSGYDHLNKNQYRPGDLAGWVQALDAFFAPEQPGTRLTCPGFDKFTEESLDRATHRAYRRAGGQPPQNPFFAAASALRLARLPLEDNYDLRVADLKRRLVDEVRTELPRRLRQAGAQSFDDLLHAVDRALSSRGGKTLAKAIRSRYQAALIDEFQDTDPVQYRIFRQIYAGTRDPVMLIGDPKQAIYGFRGADIYAYIEAAREAGERRFTMDTNWRSDPHLVAAVNHLFDVPRPFFLSEIGLPAVRPRPEAQDKLRGPDGPLPALEVRFVPRADAPAAAARRSDDGSGRPIAVDWAERELPGAVADDVVGFLGSGATIDDRRVGAGDIAILVRKNDQALRMQAALRDREIPSVIYGDASVFETPQAEQLSRVLAAVAEPSHGGLLRAAVTTELLGVTVGELEAMGTTEPAADGSHVGWDRWVNRIRRWHERWQNAGFIQMFHSMLDDAAVARRLLETVSGERQMTNLLHLSELLHAEAATQHLGPAGLMRWFSEQRIAASERGAASPVAEAQKLRLERDDAAVQIVTVHRAKGLEYPVVYCPYLWDGLNLRNDEEDHLLFHDPDHGDRLTLDIRPKGPRTERDKDPHIVAARFERSAENLRLCYVALTRARHRAVVYWGAIGRSHRSALGYLLHAPTLDPKWPWDPELVASGIKEHNDEALLAWLHERSGPGWAIEPWRRTWPKKPSPPVERPPPMRSRRPAGPVVAPLRVSSFSALASGGGAPLRTDAAPLRDRDALLPEPMDAPTVPDVPLALGGFPRGAKAGNLFHEILEHIDFVGAGGPQLQALVGRKLEAYGYAATWAATCTAAIEAVLDTPLSAPHTPGGGPRLRDVPLSQRLTELEFVFPVGDTSGTTLSAQALAEVFAQHDQGLPADYPKRIAAVDFAPLQGFLKGFIDLVFQFEDRWYLVDYKTNFLGLAAADYAADRLPDALAHGHYYLQYHLYAVAVHRFLSNRLPDYDYDRHFGGVYYLFLRGMDPSRGPATGVHFELPPRARIEALSQCMAKPPPRGSR